MLAKTSFSLSEGNSSLSIAIHDAGPQTAHPIDAWLFKGLIFCEHSIHNKQISSQGLGLIRSEKPARPIVDHSHPQAQELFASQSGNAVPAVLLSTSVSAREQWKVSFLLLIWVRAWHYTLVSVAWAKTSGQGTCLSFTRLSDYYVFYVRCINTSQRELCHRLESRMVIEYQCQNRPHGFVCSMYIQNNMT